MIKKNIKYAFICEMCTNVKVEYNSKDDAEKAGWLLDEGHDKCICPACLKAYGIIYPTKIIQKCEPTEGSRITVDEMTEEFIVHGVHGQKIIFDADIFLIEAESVFDRWNNFRTVDTNVTFMVHDVDEMTEEKVETKGISDKG